MFKEILEEFAAAQSWSFDYGRADYHNLFGKQEETNVSHLFLDPVEIVKNRNDNQQVESITYSGAFMLLYSSKFDKASYNDRYEEYIKPIIETQIDLLEQHLICEYESTFINWKQTEIINVFDYNLDGVMVSYSVEIDVEELPSNLDIFEKFGKIIRRLQLRAGEIWKDLIADRDIRKTLLPVSVLNGVDGCVVYGNFENSSTLDFECKVSLTSGTAYRSIVAVASGSSSTNTNFNVDISNTNRLRVFGYDDSGSFVGTTSINVDSYLNVGYVMLRILLNGTSLQVYVNGIEIYSATISNQIRTTPSLPLSIGCRGDDVFFDSGIHSVKINNISIPLPHLYTTENGIKKGFGFDANNNVIRTTVSGGVSLGYDINGSSYLQDKGVVERNPELYNDGDRSYVSTPASADAVLAAINKNTTYEVSYSISEYSEGTFRVLLYNDGMVGIGSNASADGEYSELVTVNNTTGTIQDAITLQILSAPATMNVSNISVTLATPEIIPNTPTGQPAYPIVEGDTFIVGSESKFNQTTSKPELFPPDQIDEAYAFFDTSNVAIWKNQFDWNTAGLTQELLDENIQEAYKNRLYLEIKNGIIEDFVLYEEALTSSQDARLRNLINQ